MMDKYHQCQALLTALEAALRQAGVWETDAPTPTALASTAPFAVDTLTGGQWLQWIFLPRMNALVSAQAPLPDQFVISPYLEEALNGHAGCDAVLAVTRQLDALLGACEELKAKK
ncbi:YqcC family protein [Photobacterium sp. MCCC 1A19761]|uniref:YqcC family protein n=1 Tax=Photobacterium sp. MCCC 1A19761 TaxID=3115000 RepID=UPI00307D64E8